MKYILSILACLIICQVSFSQNNLSETAKVAQTKKDITAYKEFQKKIQIYSEMQDFVDANKKSESEDFIKAMELFKSAAAKGNPLAEERIGELYEWGQGVPADNNEAIKWYMKSAENGNMRGLYYAVLLYEYVPDDGFLAFNTLQRCAKAGFSGCYIRLADYFQYGRGTEKNYSKAIYWYQLGAEELTIVAMINIGNIYMDGGDGVSKSSETAMKWFTKAATENTYDGKPFPGSKYAMYQLYKMYNTGDGIKKDQAEAFKWLLKLGEIKESQEQDEKWIDDAYYDLGNIFYTGSVVSQNYSEAIKWFTKGAETKSSDGKLIYVHKPCMEKLVIMYREGQGVEKNLELAEEWQQKSNNVVYKNPE